MVLFASAAYTIACGADAVEVAGEESSYPRIEPGDRIYTVDDLSAAGAKTVKEYEVDDLPAATTVWKVVYNQLDYEARFYASHDDAVSQSSICTKFGSYAIFGNIVMLCQGSNKAQSIERCGLLAGALAPGLSVTNK